MLPRLVLPTLADARRFALIVALTALIYALAGWVSLQVATYVAGVIAAVWLAAGIGATASAAIMGYLPHHLQPFSPTLESVPSVAKFALVAAPLGSGASALFGVFSLNAAGILADDQVLQGMWVWWLGDMLGVYLIAPVLLTASRWDLLPTQQSRTRGRSGAGAEHVAADVCNAGEPSALAPE